MKRSRELAERLMGKAAQDEFTLRKLVPDPESPDEVIGFHAQQAVEKILKAVLVFASVRHVRGHDLLKLIDVVRSKGIDFPQALEEVKGLSAFAVGFRYQDLPEPLDRDWAMNCIRRTRAWAEAVLRAASEA